MGSPLDSFSHYDAEGEEFLKRIVSDSDTWVSYVNGETK